MRGIQSLVYLVKVPPSGLQPIHEAIEDETRIPPPYGVVRRRVAHVLLLVRPHLRAHLRPALLLLLLKPVPDGPLAGVRAHEHHPHLVGPIGEREVHLLGPRGRARESDLAGEGDAVVAVGERVAVVVDVVVGVLSGGPAEEAELVGRPQVGEPWEGELSAAAAPGGGAIEEDVAEEVAVAGGRRGVDRHVVEAIRGREVGPPDRDFFVGLGELRRGGREGGPHGLAGGEEEEEEKRGFGVHFAGDAERSAGTRRKMVTLTTSWKVCASH